MKVRNLNNETGYSPLFLNEDIKQGSGQRPEVLPTFIRWRRKARQQVAAVPILLDGIGRGMSGVGRAKSATQNPHCVKPIAPTPLSEVLESPENFLGEVFRWGSGQSPEVLPTFIRWRRKARQQVAAIPIPLDGIGRGTSGVGRAKSATQNPHCVEQIAKIPLLKVLEILKNFFQEVFKQGSGQRPEVLPEVLYAL